MTRVEQDSEHGVLETRTEYQAGLKTLVTNPRGFQTTTRFMAWDAPGYDLPIRSDQPEDKVIEIVRHPQLGRPLQLRQRSADGRLQQTRYYVYDGHAQLCKTIEPETGATLMHYDPAGNLDWSAAGLSLSSTLSCDENDASIAARKVSRGYDARNRLATLAFPDGRGNQVWTYEKDGLPATIATFNAPGSAAPVVNAYHYNKRRLLDGQGDSVSQPGWYAWGIGYGYNGNGHLATQSYPTGLVIDYAPNALGQATRAGSYATNASYFPNGALKQFTYGNGIVHTMTQNARQLPSRVTSSGNTLDFAYSYDVNANISLIWDHARDNGNGLYGRWMTYDGLDRLTSAGSCNFGGDCWHRFTYDALDNLKSWKLGGVKDYAEYVYNAQHRLTNIRNTSGATVVGLDYDLQGNLSNKNGQVYDFDYGNRLRSIPGKESYFYDGLGRRVQSTKTDGSMATLWQYSHSGQMLFSWEGPSNEKTHEFVYLAGSLVATIDHHWPGNVTIATKYQHTDALGSPVAVTNEAGSVIERNDYEPYGAIIGKPSYSGIGYTGHVMDGATGLTYMQQRYYDQSVGRFLSVDPVTANANNGVNFNRYKYALNNPYRFTDPDGRCESISTCQMMHDDIDLTEGRMSLEEHQERINARGIGAGAGLGALAIAFTRGRAAPVFGAIAKRFTSRSMSGPARQALGEIREQLVAELTDGVVSGEKVSVSGLGRTDIDVVAKNGDLVAVGGGAKARDKGNLGRVLRIYQAVAKERGVGVRAFFAKGTPKEIIDYARKTIGKDNVTILKSK